MTAVNRLIASISLTVAPMLTDVHHKAIEEAIARFEAERLEEGITWDDITIVARHEGYGAKRRRVRATDNRSRRGISWVEGVFSKAGRNITLYAAGMDFGEFAASRLQKFGDRYGDVSSAVLGESGIPKTLAHQRDLLWTDLQTAVQRAVNGHWSMECDWIVERIQECTAALYSVTPWEEAPIQLLPIWASVNRGASEHPNLMQFVVPVDWERIRSITGPGQQTSYPPAVYDDIPLSYVTSGAVKL